LVSDNVPTAKVIYHRMRREEDNPLRTMKIRGCKGPILLQVIIPRLGQRTDRNFEKPHTQ